MLHKLTGVNECSREGHPINNVIEFEKCLLTKLFAKVCQQNFVVVVEGEGMVLSKELGMKGRHMWLILIVEGGGNLADIIQY